LIAITDYNKLQAKGFIYEMMGIEPLADKWRAFGWEVIECDGHDIVELLEALHTARYIHLRGKPSMIIAHTIKGRGVDWMELNSRWHTHAPLPKEADDALHQIARHAGRPEEGYSRLGGDEVLYPGAEDDLSDRPA
jgi:transketolase